MRKVDTCSQILPQSYWDKVQAHIVRADEAGREHFARIAPTDLDARFRLMDQVADYEQILSLAMPPLNVLFAPERIVEIAKRANDELANLVEDHPDHFPGFIATLPMTDPAAAIEETFRAVKILGALGVQIATTIGEHGVDHADYAPVFRACYELDIPILMRATRGACATNDEATEKTWAALGSPYEISLAQTRLIYARLLDTLPGIKIVTHHMGGMVSFVAGRTGPGWQSLGLRPSAPDAETPMPAVRDLKKPHAEYYKDFYANTALCGVRDTIGTGLSYHPRDRVLFATDAASDPATALAHIQTTIAQVDGLEIDDEWKQDIFWRNAAKIMSFERRDDVLANLVLA